MASFTFGRYASCGRGLKLFAGINPEGLAGPKGIYWGDQWVRASRLGIGVRRERFWIAYRWSAFAKLEKRSDHLTLRGGDHIAVFIPKAAFADQAQIDEFCAFAEARLRPA